MLVAAAVVAVAAGGRVGLCGLSGQLEASGSPTCHEVYAVRWRRHKGKFNN